jgi:methylphosphotriester-DNA--protein-cysteine methyltransferase
MKKAVQVSAIVFLLVFIFSSLALGVGYLGTKNSKKYHYPTCKLVQKSKADNLVKFNSPEEARKAGYAPCKICRPPETSRIESGSNRPRRN